MDNRVSNILNLSFYYYIKIFAYKTIGFKLYYLELTLQYNVNL